MAMLPHRSYRRCSSTIDDIIKKFTYLYTSVSDAFTNIDDYMIFYIDLYSHCDAAFCDLLREQGRENSLILLLIIFEPFPIKGLF